MIYAAAYQAANDSAKETLASQVGDRAGKPSAREMQARDMPNSVMGERNWKISNAGLAEERAADLAEEKREAGGKR